jgi:tetratricopeptide (TPR) repeat protein
VGNGPALRVWYDNPTLEGFFLSDYKPDAARPAFFFMHDDDTGLMEVRPGIPDNALLDPPPLYADALNDLGTSFMVANERGPAIAAWRKVVSIQPNHPAAARNLGIALVQNGRFVEGVGTLERALALTPENAGVVIHLAKGLASLGRNDAAQMHLRKFIHGTPNSSYQREAFELLNEISTTGAGDLDTKVIAELEATGSDLSIPHVLEFFLYFPAEDAVRAAAREIGAEGFVVQDVFPTSSSDWACIATRRMVPEHGKLARIRARFNAIATRLGGQYEGWGTTVVLPHSR